MIHHYINLVCWRSMLKIYEPERDIVWVDSISLLRLLSRFGCSASYLPGHFILRMMGPYRNSNNEWFFLTSSYLNAINKNDQIVLPLINDNRLPSNVVAKIQGLKSGTIIGIGISSPKQNFLAAELYKIRSDLEYHCLGAALAQLGHVEQNEFKTLLLSKKGFGIIWFLLTQPRRTVSKLMITLKEYLLISLSPHHKEKFKQFMKICRISET